MIVYRVADGKGWTKDTYAQTVTSRITDSTLQLSHMSALRAAPTSTFASDAVKSFGVGVQVTQEVYMNKDSASESEQNV